MKTPDFILIILDVVNHEHELKVYFESKIKQLENIYFLPFENIKQNFIIAINEIDCWLKKAEVNNADGFTSYQPLEYKNEIYFYDKEFFIKICNCLIPILLNKSPEQLIKEKRDFFEILNQFENNSNFDIKEYYKKINLEEIDNKLSNVEEKFNNIFKDKSFKLFRMLKEEFDIKDSSRTDFKFIFEEMKRDGFIYNTISQKHFLEWFNDFFSILIDKTSNHSRSEKRLKLYRSVKDRFLREES